MGIQVRAPSNIALIKYWGKRDAKQNWPCNDSLSMTLNHCHTTTTVSHSNSGLDEVFVDGRPRGWDDPWLAKSWQHLERLRAALRFAAPLRIETSNSFPAGTGIASSASSMAALTLGVACLAKEVASIPGLADRGLGWEGLCGLARQGSGSACRSLAGGFVWWRSGDDPAGQSVVRVHDEGYWRLADTIVIVSSKTKSTASTAGHALASTSPLFNYRLSGLAERLRSTCLALEKRDFSRLGEILETEAMEMHCVMMTGSPRIQYLEPTTLAILAALREARWTGRFSAFFTLDAGPNVHIVSPESDQGLVQDWLQQNWPHLRVISDVVGPGPSIMAVPD